MTARDGFTRLVDTWLAEEGTPTTPDYLDLVLDRTSTTRQRPVWLSPGRWLPVNTTTLNPRAWSIPPVARFGLLTALLIALAIAAVALYAGSQRHRVPSPFGPAANGQLYFDVDGTVVATNPDGSGRRIVDVGVRASGPYLSPDGTRMAFVALYPENGFRERVLVADSDGSSSHVISGDLSLDIDPTINPTWSPDGSQLAFGALHEGRDELFVANADGSGVHSLGDPDLYWRANPEWSPSGDWIAFKATLMTEPPFIAVIRPDGTDEHRVPASAGAGDGFRGFQLWAPDLTHRLLYSVGDTQDLGDAMAVMNVDTGVETIISDVPGVEEHRGAWSPDASRITFHLGDKIAVVNADGTGLITLPDKLSADAIGWSPDGSRIYGTSQGGDALVAIDASAKHLPIVVPFNGTEAGVFSWQRTAP